MTSFKFFNKFLGAENRDVLKLSNFREAAEEEWLMKYGSLDYEDILGTELEQIINEERKHFMNMEVEQKVELFPSIYSKYEEEQQFEKPREGFKPISLVIKLNGETSVVELKKEDKNLKTKQIIQNTELGRTKKLQKNLTKEKESRLSRRATCKETETCFIE
eukprot:snap_masked-scaffold_6-processed-gene-15.46-mRNA-1 protein AED:1.00 eAED:1.00 QI:0/-1/0/0/-1/1/1/0/161